MRSTLNTTLATAGAASLLGAPVAIAQAQTPDAHSARAKHAHLHQVELFKTVTLKKHLAALQHRHLPKRYRSVARTWSITVLRDKQRLLHKQLESERYSVPAGMRGILNSIAMCESHGNPRAVGGGGAFRGKYQFTFSTWASMGGQGDPAAASEREQDYRAAKLYRSAGAGQWPVCGR